MTTHPDTVRNQALEEATLYQHDDGRYGLSFGRAMFAVGDPSWHRVPLDVVEGAQAEQPAASVGTLHDLADEVIIASNTGNLDLITEKVRALVTTVKASPVAAQPAPDERGAFEAWAQTQRDTWLIVGGLTWSPSTNDYASARTNAAWAAWQARAALSTPPMEGDALEVMRALDTGEWCLKRLPPSQALTDEANKDHAWIIERQKAPFCDKDGTRVWFAATAIGVLRAAIAAMGKGGEHA